MSPRAGVLLAALAALGCADPVDAPADAAADAAPYELVVGQRLRDGGFAPVAEGASLELFLGFQGFRYARVVLAARGAVPARTAGRARLEIAGEEPTEQHMALVTFARREGDTAFSQPLLVFANDVVPGAIVGRPFTLRVDLRDPGHRAAATVTGTMSYDPTCVDDGEGACLPPDGGAR